MWSSVPIGRIGQPAEIAQTVAFSVLMLPATLRDNLWQLMVDSQRPEQIVDYQHTLS